MLTLNELNIYLEKENADFEILKQETPVLSSKDAEKYYDINYAAPAFIMQTENGMMLLIASARRGRLDFKKIAKQFGLAKLKLADRAKIESETGYKTGSIPLIGTNLPCIIDNSILEFDYIYGGSGDELHTLKISPKDVKRLNNTIGIFE